MKQRFLWIGFAAGLGMGLLIGWTIRSAGWPGRASFPVADGFQLTLSAVIDGTDRFVFTQHDAWNDHGDWSSPKDVFLQGQLWTDLSQAPGLWPELARHLDLPRASILSRSGRGIIALETTPDGFDVLFADSKDGKAPYEVVILIPRIRR